MTLSYRKVTFGFNLGLLPLSLTCGLDKAVQEADTGFTQVCDDGHAPTQIKQKRWCIDTSHGQDGAEVPFTSIKKGRKVGDQVVVVEAEEVEQVKADHVDQYKKVVSLTAHATEGCRVLPAGSVYAMTPVDASQNQAYTIMHDVVTRHPEITMLGLWTPSSRVGLYRLTTYGDALVWEQQARVEEIKVTEIPLLELPLAMQGQVDSLLPTSVQPFDPTTYADTYATAMADLVASKEAVDGVFSERAKGERKAPTPSQGVDLFAALTAAAGPAAKTTKRKAS